MLERQDCLVLKVFRELKAFKDLEVMLGRKESADYKVTLVHKGRKVIMESRERKEIRAILGLKVLPELSIIRG